MAITPPTAQQASDSQIQYANSNRFTMIVTMNQLGQYEIRVNNLDGA